MRAEIVSIGTELLLGHIVDTNSAWLATRLADLGIDLHLMATVGDNLARATETVERALSRSELVVCTGGLGPTEDDLTREAIAAALGEAPQVDPGLEAGLRGWFGRRDVAMPERNLKQAWLIPSATALANPLGTAPGWLVRARGRVLVAMPGVPREMTRMWEHEVEPLLLERRPIRSRTLKLLGIGESSVEEALGELVRSTAPTVATYAKSDGVHVRITDRDEDPGARDLRIDRMERAVRERLGRHVWGTGDETLAGVIARSLRASGRRLATAEGSSGGEIARALSDAGSEGGWYAGGIVRPDATLDVLAGLVAPVAADVVLLTAEDAAGPFVLVRVDGKEHRLPVRAASPAEARRRATLVALDLLRRVVSR